MDEIKAILTSKETSSVLVGLVALFLNKGGKTVLTDQNKTDLASEVAGIATAGFGIAATIIAIKNGGSANAVNTANTATGA